MSPLLVNILVFLLVLFQIFLLLALGFLFSLLVYAIRTVPWVPTRRKMARRMFALAELKPGQRVLDLGSGDGSLLIAAAKEFGASGIGYEIHPGLRLIARLRARLAGVSDKLEFRGGNFFHATLPDTDLIATYLFREVQEKLEPILKKRYPAGTRVVSRTFVYPNLTLVKSDTFEEEHIYLYKL